MDMAERKNIQAEADYIRTTPAAQLIAREAFKEGIEAAAAYHDKEARWWREAAKDFGATDQAMIAHSAAHKSDAAAIRKLRVAVGPRSPVG